MTESSKKSKVTNAVKLVSAHMQHLSWGDDGCSFYIAKREAVIHAKETCRTLIQNSSDRSQKNTWMFCFDVLCRYCIMLDSKMIEVGAG